MTFQSSVKSMSFLHGPPEVTFFDFVALSHHEIPMFGDAKFKGRSLHFLSFPCLVDTNITLNLYSHSHSMRCGSHLGRPMAAVLDLGLGGHDREANPRG